MSGKKSRLAMGSEEAMCSKAWVRCQQGCLAWRKQLDPSSKQQESMGV